MWSNDSQPLSNLSEHAKFPLLILISQDSQIWSWRMIHILLKSPISQSSKHFLPYSDPTLTLKNPSHTLISKEREHTNPYLTKMCQELHDQYNCHPKHTALVRPLIPCGLPWVPRLFHQKIKVIRQKFNYPCRKCSWGPIYVPARTSLPTTYTVVPAAPAVPVVYNQAPVPAPVIIKPIPTLVVPTPQPTRIIIPPLHQHQHQSPPSLNKLRALDLEEHHSLFQRVPSLSIDWST